jgi:hypothetical protein
VVRIHRNGIQGCTVPTLCGFLSPQEFPVFPRLNPLAANSFCVADDDTERRKHRYPPVGGA